MKITAARLAFLEADLLPKLCTLFRPLLAILEGEIELLGWSLLVVEELETVVARSVEIDGGRGRGKRCTLARFSLSRTCTISGAMLVNSSRWAVFENSIKIAALSPIVVVSLLD